MNNPLRREIHCLGTEVEKDPAEEGAVGQVKQQVLKNLGTFGAEGHEFSEGWQAEEA